MRRVAIVLAGLVLLTGSASAETRERTVKANTRSAIDGFFSYWEDTCYTGEVVNVKVRQEPANGSVQIVPHEQVLGKDSRCPGTKVRGLVYVYTPKKGFKGVDEFAIDVPWTSTDIGPGTVFTNNYKIRVE
ncbi:hypothetical protein [Microvirga terricola]|uniref:Uncharacterized protein n=1 Tax=Microvirga terricola TaxID=2719797 RepID=A0ABX0VAA8_9HYPH|nr:hypothetical protein [Microvirga terricola]NIX76787.1 hypothetical protein [Microvirga terricola]